MPPSLLPPVAKLTLKGLERDARLLSGNASLSVAIGNDDPGATCMKIDEEGAWVGGAVKVDTLEDPELLLQVDGQTRWRIYSNGAGGDALTLADADASAGVVLAQDSNAWASLSDERAKTDWRSFGDALGKLRTLGKIGTYTRVGPLTREVYTTPILTFDYLYIQAMFS